MARAAKEPWLLAHSETLNAYSPQQIVRWYALRMQIESSFRDLKSHRYGCAFEDTLTRSAERLDVLLMIHMLATLVAWLAALATLDLHEHRFRMSLLRRGWEYLRVAGGLHPDS
ncbi:MAG: ISXoo8 transposase [Hydrocarboniphaga sp.]|nr:ISXoo8 transposase [Hydrocarboniphaga sp.]